MILSCCFSFFVLGLDFCLFTNESYFESLKVRSCVLCIRIVVTIAMGSSFACKHYVVWLCGFVMRI